MIGEVEASDLIKQFDAAHSPTRDRDIETSNATARKKHSNNDNNVMSYFSMNDDEIIKQSNKVKDSDDGLFRDLEPKERKALQGKNDDGGWDDEELNIVID